ncbi:hypothetical protein OIV83_006279 [Microbotryomycetes sp. JL201]|nr:hypothetical protein OIV83_006279 [Microbotryomycetes sp. JL201]
MLYVASAQHASVQLGAVACDFVAPGETALVVNKLTRLEVYSVDASSAAVELAFEVPVPATIAAFAPFKLDAHGPSSLLVLTTSMQLFAIEYSGNAATSHVNTLSSISIHEQFGRPAECQTIVVDPNQSCIVVHAYCGLARVVPLLYTHTGTSTSSRTRRGSKRMSDAAIAHAQAAIQVDLSMSFDVRLPELNVTSLVIMSGTNALSSINAETSPTEKDDATQSPPMPVLALVHLSHSGSRVLVTHTLDLGARELVDGPISSTDLADPGSETVIPVDCAQGESGVLVVGEETVTWIPVTSPQTEKKGKRRASSSSTSGPTRIMCRLPVGMIQAWTAASSDKFLLGDIYGKLLLLTLTRSPSTGRAIDLTASDIGDTSSPTALVLLSPEILYLASRFGDSQLIRIPAGTLSSADQTSAMDTGEGLQLLDSFTSLAPILDCCIVRPTSGGPSRVVTCSGAYKGGSLRVISQGMGVTELASLDVEGVQRLWTVADPASSSILLVVGLLNETRFIKLVTSETGDIDDIDEFESELLLTDEATLHAGLVGGVIVQVCNTKVLFSKLDGTNGGSWVPPAGRVTHAATAGDYLLLALEGGQLQLFNAAEQALAPVSSHALANEASSISLAQYAGQTVALAATWSTNEVSVLSVPKLEVISSFKPPTTYPIRSLAAATYGDDMTVLFVGFGDGALATYSMAQGIVDAATERITPLGTKPVELNTFVNRGKASVVAVSDRPTVISRSNDRLVYSNVNAQASLNVTALASMVKVMPSCVAISDPTTVRIARLDDIRRMDVRTIPLDEEEPRRIAYSASLGVYAVLCLKRDVDRSSGRQTSDESVHFFSEDFERIGSFKFETDEGGQSITSLSVPSEDEDVFVIGTVEAHPDEPEPTKGRLRLFRRQASSGAFELSSEAVLPGCPYAVAAVGTNSHVAVAVNSQVLVYAVDVRSGALTQEASWGGAFVAFNLAVAQRHPNRLIVGDALRSVTLLDFVASGPSGPSLKEVTCDYDAHYMSAVAAVSDNEYIGAETDLNLFTLLHDAVGSSQGDDALTPMGRFHLGQMVSKFQTGALVQSGTGATIEPAAIIPKLVFATSAGMVGVVVDLDAETSKLMSALERNMRQVVPSVGDLDQEAWRAFKSDRRTVASAGFVDGDFVQQFVELSPEDMDKVVQGAGKEHQRLDVSTHEVLKLVEELSRLH